MVKKVGDRANNRAREIAKEDAALPAGERRITFGEHFGERIGDQEWDWFNYTLGWKIPEVLWIMDVYREKLVKACKEFKIPETVGSVTRDGDQNVVNG